MNCIRKCNKESKMESAVPELTCKGSGRKNGRSKTRKGFSFNKVTNGYSCHTEREEGTNAIFASTTTQ